MGDSLLILGHHYQQDEVIRFADLRGDSYKLSQLAAREPNVPRDRLLRRPLHGRDGRHPLATRSTFTCPTWPPGAAWPTWPTSNRSRPHGQTSPRSSTPDDMMPVTYINSSAELKAFCGRHGGIVCTSSNARAVLEWSFAQRGRVLFFPDQHLGRNTARAMGIPLDQMAVWDPREPLGGNTAAAIASSRVLLWKGHCSVHQMFKPDHVEQFRRRFPDSKILVHPECMMQVVDAADLVGSTEFIIKTIAQAPAGSTWGVGTELHLVNRLAHENPDKTIHFLSPMVCMCATMYRIDLPHLAWCLDNLARGTPVNRIKVPAETAHWARIALERMLQVT